jgi:hypothetical protein
VGKLLGIEIGSQQFFVEGVLDITGQSVAQ